MRDDHSSCYLPGGLGVHCCKTFVGKSCFYQSEFYFFFECWCQFSSSQPTHYSKPPFASQWCAYKPFIHAVNSEIAVHLCLKGYSPLWSIFPLQKVSCSSLPHTFPHLTLLEPHLPNSWFANLGALSFSYFLNHGWLRTFKGRPSLYFTNYASAPLSFD